MQEMTQKQQENRQSQELGNPHDVERCESAIYDLRAKLKEQASWNQRAIARLAERENTIGQLQAESIEKDSTLQLLKARIAAQEVELEKDSFSIRFRILKNFRQFRSRYLLPAYELLHLSRQEMEYESSRDVGVPELMRAPGSGNGFALSKHKRYQQLTEQIREIVSATVPANATVLIVSKGDNQLLQLNGHRTGHFPQAENGAYAGYYPPHSEATIKHLEMLQKRGAAFLLFPNTAFWWLEYYADFCRYLNKYHRCIWNDRRCIIYEILEVATSAARVALPEIGSDGELILQRSEGMKRPRNAIFPRSSNYDVICFPVIDWNFRFQRPQQLSTQFARAGHRVFYLRTTFHDCGPEPLTRNIADNIYEIEMPGPTSLNLYQDEMDGEILDELRPALDEFRLRAGISEALCLVDLPFWAPLAVAAQEKWGWRILYDCMDEHSAFSSNNPAMIRWEEELIAKSDLVLATSKLLYQKITLHNENALLVPNGADFDHFSHVPLMHPLRELTRPIIGYFGAIAEWFDVEMVRSAAMARPDWQFVLIGHTYGSDVSPLETLPNIHLLGEQSYQLLPSYLHEFDVACIPFLLSPLTEATNPVKFYEYLSAGKPVVSVVLPELNEYRDYYYPVWNAADFVKQIGVALEENSPEKIEARVELARENTWSRRHRMVSDAVKSLYPKVAIVIVSFINLDYLKLCLESIWAKTIYPNFEVIVVDNGAQPQIVRYLEATALAEPRLKLILNGENLGFARANNIGMQAASQCDYIILLNDDVVVTQGWLGKMVRHLEDPQVGLIGPVTNWAGNEAKIDVDYDDLKAMEQFAERHMLEHAGKTFEIPMLAMYCVGFRKPLLDQVGFLDEQFGIGMFEDDDFSWRVRQAGQRVVCAEDIFIHHFGRASFSRMEQATYECLFEENRKKFESKWARNWQPHSYRSSTS